MPDADTTDDRDFFDEMAAGLDELGLIAPSKERLPNERRIADLRRAGHRRSDDGVELITLVERDGVLGWEAGAGITPSRRPGRRRRRGPSARFVGQLKFERVPPNKVTEQLLKLDHKLTLKHGEGLHEVVETSSHKHVLSPTVGALPKKGRVLLIVHGTFSHAQNLIDELHESPGDAGAKWLSGAIKGKRYDRVLAFNHPTLSNGPLLNAVDLARALHGCGATVDIVCHSRGGLVSRWWREVVDERHVRPGKTIFVGSPLSGTSLASPHQLKGAVDWLANVSRAFKTVADVGGVLMAGPFFTVASTIMGLLTSTLKVAAKSPVVDVGVALVPGLAAQSFESANAEIRRLRKNTPSSLAARGNYLAVTSSFKPKSPGLKVWKFLTEWKTRGASAATNLVFPGAHDLVVDTGSMIEVGPNDAQDHIAARSFGESEHVHHTNYFRQALTVDVLNEHLKPR